MTEMQIVKKVMDVLKSDTQFVGKLTRTEDDVPMLIFSPLLPEEWSISAKTANMYVSGGSQQREYGYDTFMMSCRAGTYTESRSIAHALHDALNRHCADSFFVVTTVLQTLSPSDAELDNFNTPVEILVRSI